MLKKGLCLLIGIMMLFCQINVVHATNLASGAESAILIDANSQQVLYHKNETKRLYPASTTKIMTMILLFEAIKEKRINWNDTLSCSAYAATMGAYLIKIGGEKLFSVTSLYDSYIREKNHQKFWLVNTNKLLKQYQGVDGLKTGYTKEAGYCIVTTCKKDNLRLIGVLMNEDKPQTRNEDMKGLLNYGYSKYQQIKLYSKGEVLDTLKIKDLVDQEVKVITPKDIYYLNDRASKGEVKTKIKYNQIELPVFKNQEIGELVVKKQNKTIASYSLYLEKDVKKMNFLDKLLRVYKSLI